MEGRSTHLLIHLAKRHEMLTSKLRMSHTELHEFVATGYISPILPEGICIADHLPVTKLIR